MAGGDPVGGAKNGRWVGEGGLNQSGVYQSAPVIRELTKNPTYPPPW
jgi:hypothetical protein